MKEIVLYQKSHILKKKFKCLKRLDLKFTVQPHIKILVTDLPDPVDVSKHL